MSKMRNSAVTLLERPSEVFALGESDKQRFFSTWYYIAVWLLSFLPEENTEGEFSKRLKLPLELINEAVDFLIAAKLCKRKNGQVVVGPVRTHLEGSKPLRRQHHLNWRIKGMDKLLLSSSGSDFNLSFPMCLSSNDSTVIKGMLREIGLKSDVSETTCALLKPSETRHIRSVAIKCGPLKLRAS